MTRRWILSLLVFVGLVLVGVTPSATAATQQSKALNCSDENNLYCPVSGSHTLPDALAGFPSPNMSAPVVAILVPVMTVHKPVSQTVTYDVTTRGTITADLAQFEQQVAETYADSRGWARLGVQFKEVNSGGQYTIVLSEASHVPDFGNPCDSNYSCQTGRYVIINQDRWLGATQPWNDAGGDLRNYRHMVVNHETGHWLGHSHTKCSGAGQPATVMMQQSIDLGGCKFNPWPQDSEIWSTRLGV
jgi:hypothetical protein